jgi:hypothetical protein
MVRNMELVQVLVRIRNTDSTTDWCVFVEIICYCRRIEGHPNAVSNLEQERIRYVGTYYKTRKGSFACTYIGDRLLS